MTFTLDSSDPLHRQVIAYLVRLAQIAEDPRLQEYRKVSEEFQEHEA